jgi:hypothetical protein
MALTWPPTAFYSRLRLADFERASFHHARVSAAIDAGRLAERCGFIFHIGHVGSTVLIRGPVILRTLASSTAKSRQAGEAVSTGA